MRWAGSDQRPRSRRRAASWRSPSAGSGARPGRYLSLFGCVYGVLVAADSGIYSARGFHRIRPTGELGSAQAGQAFIGFLASAISR